MATVHLARAQGPAGFARTVVVKRLHAALARDPQFATVLVHEARIAARLHHPNVVATLDVVNDEGHFCLVLEYVHALSLAALSTNDPAHNLRVPPRVACAIASGVLFGLHAAHEARDEQGRALEIVHRDVSPQNILVGEYGVPRLIDFGIARARMHAQSTTAGRLKGKLGYLAPEQLSGRPATRQSDIYATGVVLWELLTGRRLFSGANEAWVLEQIRLGYVDPPSKYEPSLPESLDNVVLRALSTEPSDRYETARAAALALQDAMAPASVTEVGDWVATRGGSILQRRAQRIAEIAAQELTAASHVEPARRWPWRFGLAAALALGSMTFLSAGAFSEGRASQESRSDAFSVVRAPSLTPTVPLTPLVANVPMVPAVATGSNNAPHIRPPRRAGRAAPLVRAPRESAPAATASSPSSLEPTPVEGIVQEAPF